MPAATRPIAAARRGRRTVSGQRLRALAGAVFLAALLVGGLQPHSVLAHAAYARSAPAFAAELPASPDRVDLWFTQELFRREGANTLTLEDADGRAWPLAPAVVDPDDRTHLSADLSPPLSPGRYLLRWTNLSADDGDDDAGVLPFYVGIRPTPAQVEDDRALARDLLIPYPGDRPPAGAASEGTAAPSPTTVAPPLAEAAPTHRVGAGPVILGVASVAVLLGLVTVRLRARQEGNA